MTPADFAALQARLGELPSTGAAYRAARDRVDLTQVQAAALFGRSQGTISRRENEVEPILPEAAVAMRLLEMMRDTHTNGDER